MDHCTACLCTVTVDPRESDGSVRVVRLIGELDSYTAPDVERQLLESAGSADCVADLSDLSFLSAAGLDMFVRIRDRCGAAGRTFWLRNPQPIARRVLELTNLEHLLDGPDS